MLGRFHYYEGHDMQTIALPVRVLRALGAKMLVGECEGIRMRVLAEANLNTSNKRRRCFESRV